MSLENEVEKDCSLNLEWDMGACGLYNEEYNDNKKTAE